MLYLWGIFLVLLFFSLYNRLKSAKNAIKKVVKENYGHLKNKYKFLNGKQLLGVNRWITDNFFILQKECKSLQTLINTTNFASFTTQRCTHLPKVFEYSRELCKNCKILSCDKIINFMKDKKLNSQEINFIVSALKIVQIEKIYTSSLENTPENEEQISDCIQNIIELNSINTKKIYEELSVLERFLNADPEKIYPQCDQQTKEYLRNILLRIASTRNMSETQIGTVALNLAQRHNKSICHSVRALNLPFKYKKHLYFISIFALTFAIAFGFFTMAFLMGASAVICTATLVIAAFLGGNIAINIVNCIFTRWVKPNFILKLDYSREIPSKNATLAVISSLITSADDVESLCKKLEDYYICNSEKNLYFGILGDFPDSQKKENSDDKEIISLLDCNINKLNHRYGGKFVYFMRKRQLNKPSEIYQGWERKRGAISQLMQLVRGENVTHFVQSNGVKKLPKIKYIITLDSDTNPLRGNIATLVGAMAHPCNAPVVKNGRVVRGFGVMQPRIILESRSASKSYFAKILSGQTGLNPYVFAVSDVYQDVFGAGIFMGKGIFDVDVYLKVLQGKIAENTVLSHDLLEGSILRTGYVSDVCFMENFTWDFQSYMKRKHRWIRGDWQLLPYFSKVVYTENNSPINNPLPPLAKWQMFDNMRRSLVPVASAVLVILSFSLLPGNPLIWLSLALINIGIHLILQVVCGDFSNIFSGFRSGLRSIYKNFMTVIFEIFFLPYNAYVSVDAICRSLWRVFYSHKNLLDWVTARETLKKRSFSSVKILRETLPVAVFVGILWLCTKKATVFSEILGIAFLLSPLIAYYSSKKTVLREKLSPDDKIYLKNHAEKIWNYFNDFFGEADNYLLPDNLQVAPPTGLARRTSPTNIGLQIGAIISGYQLKFISAEQMVNMMQKIFDTIEKLPKYNGQLYNWYDTADLSVLSPPFISAVDNGNFISYIILAKSVFEQLRQDKLVDIANKIIENTDFSLFYKKAKNLLAIGYDPVKMEQTENCYDLLASEARTAAFIAVSLGQIPPTLWQQMGRTLVTKGGDGGLVSWSGTMFEYLMPTILMENIPNTLLWKTYNFAVKMQVEAGKKLGIPWGVSECAYFAFNKNLNYMYKALGNDILSARFEDGESRIISPYSTFMAGMIMPKLAIKNLKNIEKLDAGGEYGLYESLDFTEKSGYSAVKTYMVHHLGMSLLSINNLLNDNILQKYFGKVPYIRANQHLLAESIPENVIVPKRSQKRCAFKFKESRGVYVDNIKKLGYNSNLVTNGQFSSIIFDNGEGYSFSGNTAITPYEPTQNADGKRFGEFIYCKYKDDVMSTTSPKATIEFTPNCSKFTTNFHNIICVRRDYVPENVRGKMSAITIKNQNSHPVTVDVTTYSEIALATLQSYISHPVFSNLFIKTAFDHRHNCLIATRNIRGTNEEIYAVQKAFCHGDFKITFDTNRADFVGRGSDLQCPNAVTCGLSGSVGFVLDPIFAISLSLKIPPGDSVNLGFLMGYGESLRELDKLITAQPVWNPSNEVSKSAFLGNKILKSLLKITKEKRNFPPNKLGVESLWKWGISGDYPLITTIIDNGNSDIAKQVQQIVNYYNKAGFKTEVIYICKGDISLEQCGILRENIIDATTLEPDELNLILTASGIVFKASLGDLAKQCEVEVFYENTVKQQATGAAVPLKDVEYFNGYGGFTTSEYIMKVQKSRPTPLPWTNVIANKNFGFITTQSGGGYVWNGNSRENKLTQWSNDPVFDTPSNYIEIENRNTGEIFTTTPNPRGHTGDYIVKYGSGYAEYFSRAKGLEITDCMFVHKELPIKFNIVTLQNLTDTAVTAKISFNAKIVMGDFPHKTQKYLISGFENNIFTMKNPFSADYKNQVLYATSTEKIHYYSGDVSRENMLIGSGLTPILYIATEVVIPPAEVVEIGFSMGENCEYLSENIEYYKKSFREVRDFWENKLGKLQIKTDNRPMDLMVNRWLPYQTLACRIWGRTAFYQAGGAFGFRDQLQDVINFMPIDSSYAREQILKCASHQYIEGDVMHWWHETGVNGDDTGVCKGVRTRFSDDLLWLPYCVYKYVNFTGDKSILLEECGFVASEPLGKEDERYETPRIATERETVTQHCKRAINRSLKFGAHGLAFFGSGDWNDGMNKVGNLGKGESVWLSWFLADILHNFGKLIDNNEYENVCLKLVKNIEKNAWDGKWYKRGFFDDGTALGSAENMECKIDIIAQAWAVLSGLGDKKRCKIALNSAIEYLVDFDNELVKLLTPAFEKSVPTPGYIQSYLPGVRENGGQYTHAVAWLILALVKSDKFDVAEQIFNMILPINHSKTKQEALKYKAEPYVLAADVYTTPHHSGRGGWSWYTGASGWLYTAALEGILGMKFKDGKPIDCKKGKFYRE